MRIFIFLIISFFLASPVYAQYKKRLHDSFEIPDTVSQLQFSILGNLEIQHWVGSAILIESNIQLDSGNESLFNFLKKSGRYDLTSESIDSTLLIKSALEERPPISIKTGAIQEVINIKIRLPDTFVAQDSVLWRRKEN